MTSKEWIDNASYKEMLSRNRFGTLDDTIFQGDIGIYFSEQMRKKKNELDVNEQVRISKEIGWDS